MAPEDSATDTSDDYRGDYNQAMEHALLGQIGFFPDFDAARQQLGIKTIYTLTDKTRAPKYWNGAVGHITPEMIKKEAPDYANCLFYLSGPNAMVTSFEETLVRMGVSERQIKKDFFPGFT